MTSRRSFALTLMVAVSAVCGAPLAAHAWRVEAYSQFDGTFATTCASPRAQINIVMGSSEGQTLKEVADNLDGLPPVSIPIDASCEDGRLDLDLAPVVDRLAAFCGQFGVFAPVCDGVAADVLARLAPPTLREVAFTWRPNGFTWLFGVNVADAVYTFEDEDGARRDAVIFTNLTRASVKVGRQWLVDATHGIYTNLVDAAPAWTEAFDGPFGLECAGGVALHSHGDVYAGDAATLAGHLNLIREAHCSFPMGNDGRLGGISLSATVQFDYEGERVDGVD